MYGYYIKESGKVRRFKGKSLTNHQAELLAVIEALKDPDVQQAEEVAIYSDNKNVVGWLNHEYAINEEHIRELCLQVWDLITKGKSKPKIEWIERKKNPAGKMLGS